MIEGGLVLDVCFIFKPQGRQSFLEIEEMVGCVHPTQNHARTEALASVHNFEQNFSNDFVAIKSSYDRVLSFRAENLVVLGRHDWSLHAKKNLHLNRLRFPEGFVFEKFCACVCDYRSGMICSNSLVEEANVKLEVRHESTGQRFDFELACKAFDLLSSTRLIIANRSAIHPNSLTGDMSDNSILACDYVIIEVEGLGDVIFDFDTSIGPEQDMCKDRIDITDLVDEFLQPLNAKSVKLGVTNRGDAVLIFNSAQSLVLQGLKISDLPPLEKFLICSSVGATIH